MPRKLLIQTRNNQFIREIILTLRRLGVECDGLDIQRRDILARVLSEKERTLMLWAGPWRRMSSDLQPPSPYRVYAEHGYGLQHYETIGVDAIGHGRHSSLPYLMPTLSPAKRAAYEAWVERFVRPPRLAEGIIAALPKPPFIFMPLQLQRDTVIQYDAPDYCQDRGSMLRTIAEQLPGKLRLVAKRHPKDNTPVVLPTRANVSLIEVPVGERNSIVNHYLFSHCEAVLTINSSMAIEALHYGKPLITLGTGVFTGNRVSREMPCIDGTLFDDPGRGRDQGACDALLAEICLNRQIHNADAKDEKVVLRVFAKLNDVYRQRWGEDLIAPDIAADAEQL